ncbi:PE family protein [Tsukamurella strandjordii]|uniref:PE family protein n=1 Tax=Tsukamurella strandjordii TaxID=147577 RepID=A0AA90NEU4_9ACTN|nr:PE family protein [Tsukamurella strandjordii]MDP0397136.1 PE family protein [Tsukamurella strandjordii]
MVGLNVAPLQLLSGTNEVIGNVASTSGLVGGAAGTLGAVVPAGADDVSLLVSAGSAAHAANYLAVTVVDHAEVAQYAVSLSAVAATYIAADNAVKF